MVKKIVAHTTGRRDARANRLMIIIPNRAQKATAKITEVLIVQGEKLKKAHPSLRKTELVFIFLAVFAIAFTLGMYFRKPSAAEPLYRETVTVQPSYAKGTTPAFSSPKAVYMKKININTASIEELKDLPEVGEVLAGRIAAFRSTNGAFKKIEDIMKVAGIGEKTFDRIKDYITVE